MAAPPKAAVRKAPNPPSPPPSLNINLMRDQEILAQALQEILATQQRILSLLSRVDEPEVELKGRRTEGPTQISITLPGQLATMLSFQPKAKDLAKIFETSTTVPRGRGVTTTMTFSSDLAPKVLNLIKAANQRQSHRDLIRLINELSQ